MAGAHALDIDALATIRATGLDCAGHRGAATAAAALAAAAVRKLALPVLLLAVAACARDMLEYCCGILDLSVLSIMQVSIVMPRWRIV